MSRAALLALTLAAVCAVGSRPALARGLKVTLDTDQAAINEFFEVTVQVSARHVQLQVPKTDDFEVEDITNQFAQPIFCMNMGYEVVAGPCVFKFRFSPRKAGRLRIPGFRILDDFWNPGRVVGKSRPVEVRVSNQPASGTARLRRKRSSGSRTRGSGSRSRKRGSGGPAVPGEEMAPMTLEQLRKPAEFAKYDLFLVPTIDATDIYLNQPFKVDYLLYVGDQSGASQLQGLELPDMVGFRKERVEVDQSEEGKVTLGGTRYSVHLLARYVLIPMEAGDKELSSARATVLAAVSSFQQFGRGVSFSFSSGSTPVEVFSPPVKLTVRTVPTPHPEGFDTANIGVFRLANLEPPPTQPAGSWMVLKYDIEGVGNLLSVSPPTLGQVRHLESRKPYLDSSQVKVDDTGIQGRVQVQLPFRTTREGKYRLPPLRLAYFDPVKKSFGESLLEVPELTVISPQSPDGSGEMEPVEAVEGIVSDASLDPVKPRGRWGVVLAALYAGGVPLLYVLLLTGRGIWALLGRDSRRRRRRLAVSAARRDLKAAEKHLGQKDAATFHALLARGLASYLEGRFGFSLSSTTHDRVEKALVRRGVPPETARDVRAELESSEYGRFAPTSLQRDDMEAALKRAQLLVGRLDRCRVESQGPGEVRP